MQSNADKLFAEMDGDIFNEFGVKGVFNSSIVIDVILDRDVIREDNYGESIRNSFEITVKNVEVGKLSKGNTVDIAADSYEIVDIVVSDSNISIGAAVHVSG